MCNFICQGMIDFHTVMTRTQNDVINSSRNHGFMAKILQDSDDESNSFASGSISSDSSVSSFIPVIPPRRLPNPENRQKFFQKSGNDNRATEYRSMVEIALQKTKVRLQ